MKPVEVPEPWTPAQGTERIRAIAQSEEMSLAWKDHAKDQLTDRGLIMGDLHYLLRNGFVYEPAEEATSEPFWKYQIQCTTPNSKSREVRAGCDTGLEAQGHKGCDNHVGGRANGPRRLTVAACNPLA